MRQSIFLLCLCCVFPLSAEKATAPKHLFHPTDALTAASSLPPRSIADSFLNRMAPEYGLSALDLAGAYVAKEYKTAHNGVTHFVNKQRFQDVDVYNAEWTVNIDRDGRVINAGGFLHPAPEPGVMPAAFQSAMRAVRLRPRQ